MITALIFSISYAIKGGLLGLIPGWNKIRAKDDFLDAIMDGKVISTVIILIFGLCVLPYEFAILLAAGWLLGIAPSIGEEAGACGRYKHAWGQYVSNPEFGRKYGVKKAIQRGVFMGACLSFALGWSMIIAGATFPICYFVGQEIYYRIHKKDSWFYAEFLYGAVLGLCAFL